MRTLSASFTIALILLTSLAYASQDLPIDQESSAAPSVTARNSSVSSGEGFQKVPTEQLSVYKQALIEAGDSLTENCSVRWVNRSSTEIYNFKDSDEPDVKTATEIYRRVSGGKPAIKVISGSDTGRDEITFYTDASGKKLIGSEGTSYTLIDVPEQVENVGTILNPKEVTVPEHKDKKLYSTYKCSFSGN